MSLILGHMAKNASKIATRATVSKNPLTKQTPLNKQKGVVPLQIRKVASEYSKVFDFMGIVYERPRSQSEVEYIHYIRKGLPNSVIPELGIKMEITDDDLSSIFHVSKRTLIRRKPSDPLNPEQTERAIELARLYVRGEEVFDALDNFKEWMNSKILALGNKKPKAFLDTSLGINLVLDELTRIEHGVYS